MTRKKKSLAFITDDTMRKSTFNKRKKGVLKKINELSVLCGVDACAVIYNPFSSDPELWPTNSKVKNTVERFEMLSKIDQEKKMVNHEGFIKENIKKTMDSIDKKMKDNMEKRMKEVMFSFLDGSGNKPMLDGRDLEELQKYIDQYIEELTQHKNEILNQPRFERGDSSSTTANVMASPPSNVITLPPTVEAGSSLFFPNLDAFNSSHQVEIELWGNVDVEGGNEQP